MHKIPHVSLVSAELKSAASPTVGTFDHSTDLFDKAWAKGKVPKVLKVVIDTNVILSAVLFGGKPANLLEGIQKQKFVFCISEKLTEEVFDKLTNKFLVSRDILNAVSIIFSYGVLYYPNNKAHLPKDPDDEYLLELAEECQADYLITGDKKHLLPLKTWKTTKIITPARAAAIFLTFALKTWDF